MAEETFWDAPQGGAAEVVAGRYRAPDPESGEVRSWTRASNLGAVIADRFGLEKWTKRQLVRGIAARPDLLALLSAAIELDNAKCDEVITSALQAVASNAKANLGTAIHEVQSRVDLGLEVPPELERYAAGYRDALTRYGLTPVAVEVLLCNRPLESMGRGDRIYAEQDGTWVIGDTKSTGHLDLAQWEIAVQLATYATSSHVDSRGFIGEHRRFPIDGMPEQPVWVMANRGPAIGAGRSAIRTDYALAVHVDRETGATSVYRVDLHIGAHGANIAMMARAYGKIPGVLLPYVPPHAAFGDASPVVESAAPERHLALVPTAEPDHAPGATSDDTEPAEPATPLGPDRSLLAEAELMRLTKAQVQQYGRERGVTDLTHNKPALMVIYGKAGILANAPLGARNDPDSQIIRDMAGEDPTDPRTDAFRRARLAEIAAATSAGAMHAIHQRVTKAGGDQAWTDAMSDAARARLAELDASTAVTHVGPTLELIAACTTSQAIGALWEQVTVGGSTPDRWTAAIDGAARARLEAIRAATPPAPSNPFVG